jgi:hypothetical protein
LRRQIARKGDSNSAWSITILLLPRSLEEINHLKAPGDVAARSPVRDLDARKETICQAHRTLAVCGRVIADHLKRATLSTGYGAKGLPTLSPIFKRQSKLFEKIGSWRPDHVTITNGRFNELVIGLDREARQRR